MANTSETSIQDEEKRGKRRIHLFHGDKTIWIIFFFLCAVSLVEVFSALSTLTYQTGSFIAPMVRHAAFLFLGLIVVILVSNVPCRLFKLVAPCGMLLSVITLFMLLVGWGVQANDAVRWINFFGINFQPSELGKGSLVITTALILASLQDKEGANPKAFKYIMCCTVLICGLIAPENLSTAMLLFGVIILFMFIGRVPMAQLGTMLGILALVGALAFGTLATMTRSQAQWVGDNVPGCSRVPTWKNRIDKKINSKDIKEMRPEDFDIDRDAQVGHANIAIASSNVVGKMPGNSVQRDFLSQAYSDFIYAIIVEELGLAGAAFVVFLYVVLLFRASRIASRCDHNFPAFLVLGLTLLMVCQAVLNMMVAVGLFPVTGQPLPLISRGGTSTLINCAYFGMILSVSRYVQKREADKKKKPAPEESPNATDEYYSDKDMV